jgi:outer membrane protein assembly factor BamB
MLPPATSPLRRALLTVLLIHVSAGVGAADWPHWRGPFYDGISREKIPAGLPAALPVLWRTQVGTGFSTVSVSGGRVLTMGNRDGIDTVYCLDADSGAVVWKHSYPCDPQPRYYEGGPSATPTIHEGSVFTLSKKGHAFRLELATGNVVWSRDLVADHKFELPEWSFASSPFIAGDLVLLNVGRGGLALSRATGETRWVGSTETSGYATVVPFPGDPSPATHLLFSARSLIGFEATTGRHVWELAARASRDINAADPVIRGNQALFSSSSGAKLIELAADATVKVIWEQPNMRWYFNAGVLIDNHVYSMSGTTHRPTDLMCTRFDTGEVVWTMEGFHSGAMTAAGGTVILFDSGQLTLFDASPEAFRPRLQQRVLEGKCWTVPVLANGRIYVRNATGDLACLQLPAGN